MIIIQIITGCQTKQEVIVKTDHRYKTSVNKISTGEILPEIRDDDYKMVGHLATMSSYIYKAKTDSTHTPIYSGCYGKSRDLTVFLKNWERLKSNIDYPPIPKKNSEVKGLIYDVWISKSLPKTAVIVFRGTDFKSIGDWFSNLLLITKFIPRQWDQYEQVTALTPELVNMISNVYGPEVRIFTTGHSLGGGLAQQAGFTSPRIAKVFTFHTSPVDGYKKIKLLDTLTSRYTDKRIYRIYEKGEVLSSLRFIIGVFKNISHTNPEVIQIRYNFLRGNTLSEHTLHKYADSLRKYSELNESPFAVKHD